MIQMARGNALKNQSAKIIAKVLLQRIHVVVG
jgi:hypothetical protein